MNESREPSEEDVGFPVRKSHRIHSEKPREPSRFQSWQHLLSWVTCGLSVAALTLAIVAFAGPNLKLSRQENALQALAQRIERAEIALSALQTSRSGVRLGSAAEVDKLRVELNDLRTAIEKLQRRQ